MPACNLTVKLKYDTIHSLRQDKGRRRSSLKIAFVADLHGNLPALEAVERQLQRIIFSLEREAREKADKVRD